MYNINQSY